jgi:tRNA G18 (ribose-2'-O)-methylase SpoU
MSVLIRGTQMSTTIRIDSIDDPRVAPYRHLKDRDLRADGDRFVAEGRYVVRRLLASRYDVESVLCSERLIDEMRPAIPETVPVYVTSDAEINRIVGFQFHNGCLAVGRAGPLPGVEALIAELPEAATLVIAHELNNTENLGAILRIAAGFGAAGVILGPRTADVFYRQSIRVSMGNVFALRLARSDDLIRDLCALASAGVETIATVTDVDATPLPQLSVGPRRAIVLGSEAHGLPADVARACTRRVTIPMHLGTDSLNVSIAAAVFLYHLSLR